MVDDTALFAELRFCLPNIWGIVGRVEPQWERLGQAVETRRLGRGWSQKKVRQQGGPSDTLQSDIEQDRWRPTRGVDETLTKIDKGLLWTPGSASRVLAGGDPKNLEDFSDPPDLETYDPPAPDDPVDDDLTFIENLVEVMSFAEDAGDDGEKAWSSSLHVAFRLTAEAAVRIGEEMRAINTQKADLAELADHLRAYAFRVWRLERSVQTLMRSVAAAAGVDPTALPPLFTDEVTDSDALNYDSASGYDLAARDVGKQSEGRRLREEQDEAAEAAPADED